MKLRKAFRGKRKVEEKLCLEGGGERPNFSNHCFSSLSLSLSKGLPWVPLAFPAILLFLICYFLSFYIYGHGSKDRGTPTKCAVGHKGALGKGKLWRVGQDLP